MSTVAVLEVNEEAWYTANKAGALGGASLTSGYAPFPVFFEAFASTPRTKETTYLWDFGDGSPVSFGMNAAHVYEAPGTYTCAVEVTNGSDSDIATISITVSARAGTTYYVDSALGNDANAGTSSGAGAWKTANKAFAGLGTNKYGPGSQVLFKRGQTFDMSAGLVEVLGHFLTGSGFLFGAYGTGAKPKLQLIATGGTYNTVLFFVAEGMAHATFQDLEINCKTSGGAYSDFFFHSGEVYQLLFLRCDLNDVSQGIILSGGTTTRRQSGIFFADSTMNRSQVVQFFATSARIAFLGSNLAYSGNHTAYIPYCDKGVFTGSTFRFPAFGRCALRIDGQVAATPTNNVQVSQNNFYGWIDPVDGYPTAGYGTPGSPHYDPEHAHNGGGTRYNFELIYFDAQAYEEQIMEFLTFEDNVVTDAETFMRIGDYESLWIRNNAMSTPDTSPDRYRFIIGSSNDQRPVKNLVIENNVITSNEARSGGHKAGIFGFFHYAGPAYVPWSIHTDIEILANDITMTGGVAGRFMYFDNNSAPQRAEVFLCSNVVHAPDSTELIQIGGAWNSAGTNYPYTGNADWAALAGSDGCAFISGGGGGGSTGVSGMTLIEMVERWLDRYKQSSAVATAKAKAVRYINDAYQQIWLMVPPQVAYFTETESAFVFTNGTKTYLMDTVEVKRLYNTNGKQLIHLPVDGFHFYREDTSTGIPTRYTIDGVDDPGTSRKIMVRVWPTPVTGNGAGAGRQVLANKAVALVSDSDVCRLPDIAHAAVILKALELAALDDNSTLAAQFGAEATELLRSFVEWCKTKGIR